MSNPFETPQETEDQKRERMLTMLEDPEKLKQFESIIENLKRATPEQLSKARETGTLSIPSGDEQAVKGIEFDVHMGISPDVVKTITEAIQAGQKDAMEIAKKIPPEMLLALLA